MIRAYIDLTMDKENYICRLLTTTIEFRKLSPSGFAPF